MTAKKNNVGSKEFKGLIQFARKAYDQINKQECRIGENMFDLGKTLDELKKQNKKHKYYKSIEILNEKYGIDKDALKKSIDAISYKSQEEISAAAKIMEACTSYIVYKELITPEHSKILKAAKEYIDLNLDSSFKIENLCAHLSVGRTRLYELFRSELKMGISEYLRRRRVHKAKKLLKTTDLSIAQIAESVGFMLVDVIESPIVGGDGNIEYLAHFKSGKNNI